MTNRNIVILVSLAATLAAMQLFAQVEVREVSEVLEGSERAADRRLPGLSRDTTTIRT